MCNCGKKRVQYSQHSHSEKLMGDIDPKMKVPVQSSSFATFEYLGKTALTLMGNVTGKQYRFNAPGTRQNIDYRDLPGITNIPVLKRVK